MQPEKSEKTTTKISSQRATPTPAEAPRDQEAIVEQMSFDGGDELIRVAWYEHSCPWITKYCDEEHTKVAMVPVSILSQYEVKIA